MDVRTHVPIVPRVPNQRISCIRNVLSADKTQRTPPSSERLSGGVANFVAANALRSTTPPTICFNVNLLKSDKLRQVASCQLAAVSFSMVHLCKLGRILPASGRCNRRDFEQPRIAVGGPTSALSRDGVSPGPAWLASCAVRGIGFRIAWPLDPPPIKSHGGRTEATC